MLNKHYTSVLTLAILVICGITPKSVTSSDKVKSSSSFWAARITTLKEEYSVSNSNPTINSEQIYSHTNNSKETILAQNVAPEASGNGTSTDENQSFKLWWLVPLIILVPLLGFFFLKPGSGSKTEQIDEEQTTSDNRTETLEVSSPTRQNVTSEFAVDSSVTENLTPEDTNVEAIDNISIETATDSNLLDDIQEQVEDTQAQDESYELEFSLEDNQSWEESIALENFVEAEEIIDEPLTTPRVESENLESISSEELTALETIAESQPNVLEKTEETSAEIALEQTEQITEQELANISEWLNEKIDSNNKDVSVMDDFWDNLSSIAEEISAEIPSEQQEQITEQELANISEWLNEKVEPDHSVSDVANNSVDDLSDVVEDKEQDSNEELVQNSLNLEEQQTHNTRAKEGISDSTSNFLEELLNEDSSQESKH